MRFEVRCPCCRLPCSVPSSSCGTVVRCPSCQNRLRVPLPDAGHEQNTARCRSGRRLGVALILAGVLGAVPAVLHVVGHLPTPASPGIACWAAVLLLLTAIELAYAVYLMLLPDWGTLWVVSLVSLAVATGNAMLLGLVTTGRAESPLLRALDLAAPGSAAPAAWWSLTMLGLFAALAVWAGRASGRWQSSIRRTTA